MSRAIALEEGFAVQHRKTRVMRQGVRQRAAGVVINQKINMGRDDYDRSRRSCLTAFDRDRTTRTEAAWLTFERIWPAALHMPAGSIRSVASD